MSRVLRESSKVKIMKAERQLLIEILKIMKIKTNFVFNDTVQFFKHMRSLHDFKLTRAF